MRFRQVLLLVLHVMLMTMLPVPVVAQGLVGSGEPLHVKMRLVAESDAPRAGGTVDLAFVATPDPTWHGYWKNPGDAGVETTLNWTLSGGVKAGELRYPVPERLLIAGLMNYVYEGPYTQFVTLSVPAGLAAGTKLPVAVTMDYLVCTREICIPEKQSFRTELTVGDGAISPRRRAEFDQWRRTLPKPLGASATFARAGDQLRIAVPFPAAANAADAYFYPLTASAIDYAAPQKVSRNGDTLTLSVKAGSAKPGELAGVLAAGGQGFTIRAVPGAVAADSGGDEGWTTAAIWAFLGALAGGLILNIMPCVFPILSLKALSLARSGESDAEARREGLAYTAGVVLVCLALGGLLLALRAGGTSVGWAFQLTDPRVIMLLLLLVVAIAFNLAGLFEMMTPAAANKLAGKGGGAFATGALAAIIATPCTGPFMAGAMGAALVLPPLAALLVFAGLGLGLALPFLLLGFVPAFRKRLPKPGPWMDTFRKFLSLPMFVTAVALAWVLGRLAGVDAMAMALFVVTGFAIVLWAIGRKQGRGQAVGLVGPAVLVAIAVVGAVAVGPAVPAADRNAAVPAGHERFSEARLAALRAEGRPVFAYFTADWCLTCKVNEKTAIDTDTARNAFAKGKVAILVGDWTDGNPELGRFIEKHNRAGVPLYLWYVPGAAEPRVLPQVLTASMLAQLTEGG